MDFEAVCGGERSGSGGKTRLGAIRPRVWEGMRLRCPSRGVGSICLVSAAEKRGWGIRRGWAAWVRQCPSIMTSDGGGSIGNRGREWKGPPCGRVMGKGMLLSNCGRGPK